MTAGISYPSMQQYSPTPHPYGLPVIEPVVFDVQHDDTAYVSGQMQYVNNSNYMHTPTIVDGFGQAS
jgi:hypothetical protein